MGGVGFTWEHDLHLYMRRLKANELLLGTPTAHAVRLGAMLLGPAGPGRDSSPTVTTNSEEDDGVSVES